VSGDDAALVMDLSCLLRRRVIARLLYEPTITTLVATIAALRLSLLIVRAAVFHRYSQPRQ
jgi:hypothetical protein